MEIQKLIDLTAEDLIGRIQSSKGLSVFAKRRAKFEGWLKVELVDILLKNGVDDAVPEAGLIDVSFGTVAIELKTINTNYRDGIAKILTRPITKNIKDVIEDIGKHRSGKSGKFFHKYIMFIVFPLDADNAGWKGHLTKIEKDLGGMCHPCYFTFDESEISVSGCLYYGEVVNGKLVC